MLLEMQDRQRYFESRAGAAASAEQAPRPVRASRFIYRGHGITCANDRLWTCGLLGNK
jgi:hypothetical protein